MSLEKEKIVKASEILNKIANGINPVNGEPIGNDCFLQDPRMIRCLFFVQQVLNEAAERPASIYKPAPAKFIISAEEKSRVRFPEENIGINQFAKCINAVIDVNVSRKLTGVQMNNQLKKMGILSEESIGEGRKRTIANENSQQYGVVSEKRIYNGVEYDKVCFNDIGKKFLLNDLERILEYGDED